MFRVMIHDHQHGINTRLALIEECTSLSKVNLKFTFQSELQYIRMQWEDM